MKIALASDHRGLAYKEKVKDLLARMGHEAVDFGTKSLESVDYPDYGLPAARSVARAESERGILICGSGIGMSLAANKVRGIRAVQGVSLANVSAGLRRFAANVLVVEHAASTFHEIRTLIATFAAGLAAAVEVNPLLKAVEELEGG